MKTKATALRIQIKKQEVVTVDLKFPIFTLSVMDTFIPDKAKAYLIKSDINLESIMARIQETEYVPQTVVDFEDEGRQFSIWIE